jgi:hypothetical protein
MEGNRHHYYDSFADELTAKFRRVGHLVSNKSATGDYHEEILRVVLRNFLSKRFSIKTGFVYKDEAEVSNQIDILVIDEYEAAAYIYQEGDFAIVRPRSVVAVLEVKTKLDGGQFDNALSNIASVKRLTENPEAICGMIFGYDSTIPSQRNLDAWFKRTEALTLKATPRLGPSLLSFFRRGRLLLRLDFDHGSVIDGSSNYHIVAHISEVASQINEPAGEGWQLRFILALIYSACSRRELARTMQFQDHNEVQQLLAFSGGVPSGDHYELGIGFVPRVHDDTTGSSK